MLKAFIVELFGETTAVVCVVYCYYLDSRLKEAAPAALGFPYTNDLHIR